MRNADPRSRYGNEIWVRSEYTFHWAKLPPSLWQTRNRFLPIGMILSSRCFFKPSFAHAIPRSTSAQIASSCRTPATDPELQKPYNTYIARICVVFRYTDHLNLLASLSDSSKQRMSSTLTVRKWSDSCPQHIQYSLFSRLPGPFTFRIMLRLVSSINSTRTCVTPPREPKKRIISAFDSSQLLPTCQVMY